MTETRAGHAPGGSAPGGSAPGDGAPRPNAPLGQTIAGWLALVLLAGLWIAAGWFGAQGFARWGCFAVAAVVASLPVLFRRARGGVLTRVVAATLISGAAAFVLLRWMPEDDWRFIPSAAMDPDDGIATEDEETGDDTEDADTEDADTEDADTEDADTEDADTEDADTEDADTEDADTKDGSRALAPGTYDHLPNAQRVDCEKEIRPNADLTDLREGYGSDNWRSRMNAVLERRYPDAAAIVGRLSAPMLFDAWFTRGKDDWAQAMLELSTGVHESLHLVDLNARRGREHVLFFRSDEEARFSIPATFDRSEIASMLPSPLRAMTYADTYLTGQSGAQGFEMLLEEQNAYVYSTLVSVAVVDQIPSNVSTSARDGTMTFLYYVDAYLRRARTERPDTYAAIARDDDLAAAVVRLRDRAECALSLTADEDRLGVHDDELWPFVFGGEGLSEVDRLRDR